MIFLLGIQFTFWFCVNKYDQLLYNYILAKYKQNDSLSVDEINKYSNL